MNTTRVLLDLRGLVTHAFYRGDAKHTVQNAAGEAVPSAVHAVHTFIETYLLPILEDAQPIDIIAVLEGTSANARRRAVFPGYKMKDEQDADDPTIVEQKQIAMEQVQKLLLGLGSMLVKTPYAEADDTIAYLATRLHGNKVIYTIDHDLMQLWSPSVKLMVTDWSTGQPTMKNTFKGMEFEPDDGTQPAPPEMVVLYKSIVGDSSDQYKGIKGMGEGKIADLIAEYGYDGCLEINQCVQTRKYQDLEASLKESPCKLLQKLLENKTDWQMCHFLARLHPEWCEQSFGEKVVRPQWAKRVPSHERVAKVLSGLGLDFHMTMFKKFLPVQWLIDANLWNKMSQKNKDRLFYDMRTSPVVGFDWESYDTLKHEAYQQAKKGGYVDSISQSITGGSFCFGPNLQYSFYLSVNHRDTANCESTALLDLLTNLEATPIVAHFARFEMTVAKTNWDYDFPVTNLPEDTLIMASYVDENGDGGLKKLSKRWLNYDQTNYKEVVPEGKDMRDVSGKEVLVYGADDSVVCVHMRVLFKTIMECEQSWAFYKENEPFFDKALLVPFLKGIPIDYARLAELEREDDALFEKNDRELRSLLSEHCSEINRAGFETIWPEIRDYQKASMDSKLKSDEQITAKIDEMKPDILDKCRYREFGPPQFEVSLAVVSRSAKSLGFKGGIRSLKQRNIRKWIQDFHDQLASYNADPSRAEPATYTQDQEHFLTLLEAASPYLSLCLGVPRSELPESVLTLLNYIEGIYALDSNLWEGDELNIGSSLQMALLFYGKMGLPILIRNLVKDDDGVRSQFDLEGAPSTNEIAIRTWLVDMDPSDWRHRALKLVLEIRAIRTRRQLYYKPYPLWKSPVDGRIHPGIRNAGTITRRPSGSSPNVLQVSKTKDKGRMRSCFLPQTSATLEFFIQGILKTTYLDEPQLIVAIDFVQQELAILAGLSRDKNLLSCYVGDNKKDVHSMTAAAIMNMDRRRRGKQVAEYEEYVLMRKDENHPEHEEAEKTRSKYAKTTNFLIVYKGSAYGLARKVIVPVEMAEEFVSGFYHTYPGVEKFQDWTIKFARRHGYVVMPFGTRKHCDGIFMKNSGERASWERQAVNAPIQGGAAEALKIVLRDVVKSRLCEETGATLYAPVYDEIVASVPISKIYEYTVRMADIMEMQIPGTPVVLATSVSVGPNWGEMQELKERPSRERVEQAINDIIKAQEVL